MFETRIPRNSASRHDANVIVSTPNTQQDPVRDRDRVGADDARVRAARWAGRHLPARLHAPRGLDLGQPRGGGLDGCHGAPTLPPRRPGERKRSGGIPRQCSGQRDVDWGPRPVRLLAASRSCAVD